jgi:hypothetical protein
LKEKLYTIPVNEAFDTDCECPVCAMVQKLEAGAIEFTMGPSYMEDDVMEMTSKLGFCEKHLGMLYQNQNRLGLALILQSQMDKLMKDVEKLTAAEEIPASPSLFRKKITTAKITEHLHELHETCFICDKIDHTMERYIATIFHLYHTSEEFCSKLSECKGFCTRHYAALYEAAPKFLNGEELSRFLRLLNKLYLENMKRVREDLEWFINKFDYRYQEEPWKNAKDALPRTLQKLS